MYHVSCILHPVSMCYILFIKVSNILYYVFIYHKSLINVSYIVYDTISCFLYPVSVYYTSLINASYIVYNESFIMYLSWIMYPCIIHSWSMYHVSWILNHCPCIMNTWSMSYISYVMYHVSKNDSILYEFILYLVSCII